MVDLIGFGTGYPFLYRINDGFFFNPPPGNDPPATERLLAAGWGYACINPNSVQADNGAELTSGIIGLVNKGRYRKPDDWGASRLLEYSDINYLVALRRSRCGKVVR